MIEYDISIIITDSNTKDNDVVHYKANDINKVIGFILRIFETTLDKIDEQLFPATINDIIETINEKHEVAELNGIVEDEHISVAIRPYVYVSPIDGIYKLVKPSIRVHSVDGQDTKYFMMSELES